MASLTISCSAQEGGQLAVQCFSRHYIVQKTALFAPLAFRLRSGARWRTVIGVSDPRILRGEPQFFKLWHSHKPGGHGKGWARKDMHNRICEAHNTTLVTNEIYSKMRLCIITSHVTKTR